MWLFKCFFFKFYYLWNGRIENNVERILSEICHSSLKQSHLIINSAGLIVNIDPCERVVSSVDVSKMT